jgi:hypothetical protein
MAYYKYIHFLEPENGPEYDSSYEAGGAAPFSGILHISKRGSATKTRRASLEYQSQNHVEIRAMQSRK